MTITFYGWPFQDPSSSLKINAEYLAISSELIPSTPHKQRLHPWHLYGLGSSPFARRYLGNRFYFLFLALLRCFSSRGTLFRTKTSS